MENRYDIVLEVGTILFEISTNKQWVITSERKSKTRNSGGYTDKKSKIYCLRCNEDHRKIFGWNRGNILNRFRPPETDAEKVLFGSV